jgi:hypothetical protein
MFDVLGREVLYGLRRPLGTAAYRAELKSLTAMQEFGRLIVPCASPWKLGEREGALFQSLAHEGVWDVRLPHGVCMLWTYTELQCR